MKHDVIIVGGGPAGSSAAIGLARQGARVLLLEKEQSSHHKVCGEFISGEAVGALAGLGFDTDRAGGVEIDGFRLCAGRRWVDAALPFPARSLSRHFLDERLLTLCQEAGAEILRGVSVNGIEQDRSGWRASWSGGEARAPALFLATGKHDLRGLARPRSRNELIGFKMHYRLRPEQADALGRRTEIILFHDGYAGLQPAGNRIANLCLVVAKRRFAACGKSWDSFISSLGQEAPVLEQRLKGADSCWSRPLAIYGIPYGFLYKTGHEAPRGLYRLGDQMAVIPSFTGAGIAIALHTASLAVSAYLEEDSYAYHRRAAANLTPQIRRAMSLSRLLSLPSAQMILPSACRLMPGILPFFAKNTRLAASKKNAKK